ncbi:DUF1800 family protein [Neptunomonas japonica]|uniref:DUF1800 family protein n=1 Tax=Neptunomonas japonica TaxID=417574 RepID=UPI000427FC75|nr:DUF1800 family protein [Neptunomonas japonica]
MDDLQKVNRFLEQATMGANKATQRKVAEQGIERWLQDELNSKPIKNNTFESSTREIWQYFRLKLIRKYGEKAINGESNNPALPYKWYFHMAWWHQTLTSQKNLLRHRVAQALSEILVISDNSSLELDAVGMGSYYDLLYNHAFDDYSELLYKVSMHPCMGVYLSPMNNRKADPSLNTHPDENFAREVMQLFSIGLYQLHPDGSHVLDRLGRSIETYKNQDIKEMARVFTGLKADSYQYEWNTSFWRAENNGYAVDFEDGIDKSYKTVPYVNMTRPMKADAAFHDKGTKQLLNGHIQLPGNESAQTEIRAVITRLIEHPSAAPFIARHLIKQLVTSNPAPEYVRAVASKFGGTGNLKAVVEEVLRYPLHKSVAKVTFSSRYEEQGKSVQSQKLKSPLLRATQLLRTFNAHNKSGKLWCIGDDMQNMLQQHPMSSPTVFNFYKPSFVPHGPLEKNNLVAPEFELHTSANSIGYVNLMYYWFFGDYLPAVSTQVNSDLSVKNIPELDPEKLQNINQDRIRLDFSDEIILAQDLAKHDFLIDQLSLQLTGKSDLSIKPRIKHAFRNYRDKPEWVVQTIAFMLAISPEFTVQEA